MMNEAIAVEAPTPIILPAPAATSIAARSQRGMTLIEIMVVMAIIGLIGVVVAVNVGGAQDDANVMATRTLVTGTIPGVLDTYRATRREYPESLEALVEMKRLRKNQLQDAWNQPLTYEVTETGFRLCSGGPDKRNGGNDDICNDAE